MKCLSLVAALLLSVTFLSAGMPVASALTINLTYNGATQPPDNDPAEAKLMAIMQEAANRWESIIKDDHTMQVNVRYVAFTSTKLADAQVLSDNISGTRADKGLIRFDRAPGNDGTWFFDPTPSDDSEFDLMPTQLLDLPAATRASDFRANTLLEPLLEVEYKGSSNQGANAQSATGFDALSTAMHELGHLLGFSYVPAGVTEIMDGDYDLPSLMLGGRSMSAVAALDEKGKPEPHLKHKWSLMDVGDSPGVRTMPSALDVLAAATVSNWTKIDLQRQDFLVGTDWGTPGNWIGARIPDDEDDVYLRGEFNNLVGSGDVVLGGKRKVRNLFIGTSSNLRTGSSLLDVSETTTIDSGGTFPFPQIFVEAGGELLTKDLEIIGGELDMEGGLADIQNQLTNNGGITGHGTIDVQTQLNNEGIISADGGTLRFTSSNNSPSVFVADGLSKNGRVRANNGSILFLGGFDSQFSGHMEVGGGNFIEINNPWRLLQAGTLDLDGTSTSYATIRGEELRIQGALTVDQLARIQADLRIHSSAQISLPNADDRLELGSSLSHTIKYLGGSITGAGTVQHNGLGIVDSNQMIDLTGVFDWDGEAGDAEFLVNSGKRFTLMAQKINPTNNDYTGKLTLHGGELFVDVDGDRWALHNTLNLEAGFNDRNAVVEGDSIDVFGNILATGGVTHVFANPVRLQSSSQLKIAADTFVQFDSPVHFAGGSYFGNGGIVVNAGGSFSGGKINVGRLEVGDGRTDFEMLGGVLRTGLLLQPKGNFRFLGGRLAADEVEGDLLNEGGTLAPESLTLVLGNYSQTEAGRLEIELQSNAVFDQLVVKGLAFLDGLLDVSLRGGYSPMIGDAFNFLATADGVGGAFESLLLPSLDSGLEWDIRYNRFDTVLEVIAEFSADFDLDADVDADDLARWQGDFGVNGSSDADRDGDSDGFDFLAWQQQLGSGSDSIAVTQAVPEPTTCMLLLGLAGLSLIAPGRRRIG